MSTKSQGSTQPWNLGSNLSKPSACSERGDMSYLVRPEGRSLVASLSHFQMIITTNTGVQYIWAISRPAPRLADHGSAVGRGGPWFHLRLFSSTASRKANWRSASVPSSPRPSPTYRRNCTPRSDLAGSQNAPARGPASNWLRDHDPELATHANARSHWTRSPLSVALGSWSADRGSWPKPQRSRLEAEGR